MNKLKLGYKEENKFVSSTINSINSTKNNFSGILGKNKISKTKVSEKVVKTTKKTKNNIDLILENKLLKEKNGKLKKELGKYRETFNSSPDATFKVSVDGIVEVINKAMLKFLGFVNEKKIIGKILEKIVMSQIKIDKKLMKKLLKFFNKVIESKKGIKFRTKFKNKHGKDIYISIAIEPKIKNDEVIQFVCTVRDVTLEEYKKKKLKEVRKKLRETNKKLEDLSAKDWLTKVYNKRKFDEILLKEVTRSIRYNNNLSLLMIDLDYFKKINDNYGHLIGDRVLKKIAELSKMSVRDDIDAVARYGGEEFVIILPETRLEDATKVAEKIRKKIEEIKFDFEPTLKQTVSIGVTSLYESSLFSMSTKKIKKLELKKGSENLKKFYEEAFYLLVKDADKKLYKAKGEGRNRVVS